MIKEAELWVSLDDDATKKVKCLVCAHYCVISSGKLGFCKTRKNIDGNLVTLVYGSMINHGSMDPIEKKPLYHFFPGASAFSIATVSCNLRCKHCQNWHLSKSFPNDDGTIAYFNQNDVNDFVHRPFNLVQSTPQRVVRDVLTQKCKIIAYTYNEPLIWYEFVKDTSILAKVNGIKNILVTGGYSSREANNEYIKFIDGANIDIKGFSNNFYKKIVGIPDFQPILDTAEFFHNNGVHIELTYLLIPNENDNPDEIRSMCKWIVNKLDQAVPLHFSAYHPDYRLDQPHTSISLLEKAYSIAQEERLDFVYLGNVRSTGYSDTLCPQCKNIIISRKGYLIQNIGLTIDNKCNSCGFPLPIKGTFTKWI